MQCGLFVVFSVGWILDCDAEHFTEILAETVTRASLDTSPGFWDVSFNGSGVEAAGEFLFLCLCSADNGHGEEFFVDACVPFQDLEDFFAGAFFGQMGCVTFLPVELPCPEEWLRMLELPSYYRVPLVEAEGEVAVTSYPLGVVGVHDGF